MNKVLPATQARQVFLVSQVSSAKLVPQALVTSQDDLAQLAEKDGLVDEANQDLKVHAVNPVVFVYQRASAVTPLVATLESQASPVKPVPLDEPVRTVFPDSRAPSDPPVHQVDSATKSRRKVAVVLADVWDRPVSEVQLDFQAWMDPWETSAHEAMTDKTATPVILVNLVLMDYKAHQVCLVTMQ